MKSMYNMGDAPSCSTCGSHHDPQRLLLPLHGMRLHQRLQLGPARTANSDAMLLLRNKGPAVMAGPNH